MSLKYPLKNPKFLLVEFHWLSFRVGVFEINTQQAFIEAAARFISLCRLIKFKKKKKPKKDISVFPLYILYFDRKSNI